MSGQATIVVGVDGSDCSRDALRFALEEAARRGAAVRMVWAVPEIEYWPTSFGASPLLFRTLCAESEKSARQMLDSIPERGGALADVPVDLRTVGGLPAEVLVSQAEDADLLVVGHRGRGAFRSAVLGSVGLHCLLHSPIPVTVVRPRTQPAPTRAGRDSVPAPA